MGVFKDFVDALGGPKTGSRGMQRIEQLCSEIGWSINGRVGKGIILDFTTKAGKRRLLISTSNDGRFGVATVHSEAKFYPRDIPEQFGYYLLLRNKDRGLGGWELREDEGMMAFACSHTFFVDGLAPDLFKAMCEGIVVEVGEVDNGLREKGLL